jgi:hypothetical protein
VTRAAVFALALLLAGGSVAEGQEVPVIARSEIDRAVMTIGDQALLTVTVELANGFELLDPGVPRAIGDFEVVDTLTVLQSRLASGVTRVQLRYLITAFQLGPKRLPVIVVEYRGPDGARGQARTQGGHVVTVQTVVLPGEDTSDIKPLKPPLPVPGVGGDLLSLALPFAAAFALVIVAAVLALRVRRRAPQLADAPAHGPSRAALDELERVFELRLPEQGKTREHYELVAAAVRRFIAQRYGLPAEARTARELRRELDRAGVARASAQILCEILGDAESVRYQQRAIFPARAQKSMRDVIDLMRKSVVAEEYELLSSGATG